MIFRLSVRTLLCVSALLLVPGLCMPAHADEVQALVRHYFADSIFPADSFSTETHPGPDARKTQLRLTGRQTLWDGFQADYDLRYGFAYRASQAGGMRLAYASSGMEDQKIGLRHSLGRIGDMAQALRLSVLIPGGNDTMTPSLGGGHWALEPTYFLGFDPGAWGLHVGSDLGARIFTDGGSVQIRGHMKVSMPVSPSLQLAADVSVRRSVLLGAYRAPLDDGELSNFVRPGIEADYTLADGLKSVMAYQVYVAGMGGRAYQRITLGLAITY
jgi:hypothetical protein